MTAFLDQIDLQPVWDTGIPGIVVAVLGALFTALAFDARPVLSRLHVLGLIVFALLGAAAAVAGGMYLGPQIEPWLRKLIESSAIGTMPESTPFYAAAMASAAVFVGLVMMLGSPPKPVAPAEPTDDEKAAARRAESDDSVGDGLALEALGDWESALDEYDKAVRLCATNPVAYGRRGLMRVRCFQDREAVEDFEECLKLDAKYRRALEGEIRAAMKDREREKQKKKSETKARK